MTIIKNTSWNALHTITITFGRFTISALLARKLGPEFFGVFIFLQWIVDLVFMVYSVGLTGISTRFFPELKINSKKFRSFYSWFFRLCITSTILTTFFSIIFNISLKSQNHISIIYITIYASSVAINTLLSSYAQGVFNFKTIAKSSIIYSSLSIMMIILIYDKLNLNLSFFVLSLANVFSILFFVKSLKIKLPAQPIDLSINESRKISEYGINVWITTLLNYLVWARGEIPVIKAYLNHYDLGIYTACLILIGIANQCIGLATGALWPHIAKAWDHGELEKLSNFNDALTRLLILTSSLLSGAIICFGSSALTLIFGKSYHFSGEVLALLAIGTLGLSCGCANAIAQISTNSKFGRNLSIIGGILLYALLILLTPTQGLLGAALSRVIVLIATGIITIITTTYIFKKHHAQSKKMSVYYYISSVLSCCVLAGAILATTNITTIGKTLYFLPYVFSIFLFYFFTSKDGLLSDIKVILDKNI